MSKSITTTLATMAALMLVSSVPANAAKSNDRIITKCDGVVAGFSCEKETSTEVKTVKAGEGIAGGDQTVLITFPGGYHVPKGTAGFTVSNLIPPKQATSFSGLDVKLSGTFPGYEVHSKALARKAKSNETYIVEGTTKSAHGQGWISLKFPIPSPDTIVAASIWGTTRAGGRDTQKAVSLEDVRAEYIGHGMEYVIPTKVSTRNDGCDGVNPK